ncbi:MAG: hypothetical protein SGILL_009536 [Bacillariaceae sp.]
MKPRRDNSIGALHKKTKGKSLWESKEADSVAPSVQRHSSRLGSRNRDDTPSAPPMLVEGATPETNYRKKPTKSSMDCIFGSPGAVTRAKEANTDVPSNGTTSINAVHGNKSALAAWKVREAAKQEGSPVRIRSKASIATAYEEAVGISPRKPSREDHLEIPSLFTSPPLVAKRKVKLSPKTSPNSKSRKKKTEREEKISAAFKGVSVRPKRATSKISR